MRIFFFLFRKWPKLTKQKRQSTCKAAELSVVLQFLFFYFYFCSSFVLFLRSVSFFHSLGGRHDRLHLLFFLNYYYKRYWFFPKTSSSTCCDVVNHRMGGGCLCESIIMFTTSIPPGPKTLHAARFTLHYVCLTVSPSEIKCNLLKVLNKNQPGCTISFFVLFLFCISWSP